MLPAQRRARTGAGREEAVFRERGICRQDTRLFHICQDGRVCTCLFFLFEGSGIALPKVPIFYATYTKQNTTSLGNGKKLPCDRDARMSKLERAAELM